MAITIYQALDFSEALVSAVEENPFFPGSESFLSSELYIKNVYMALDFSENLLGNWIEDPFDYLEHAFDLNTLYARQFETLMLPDEGLDLHNNINNRLKLRVTPKK